MSNLKNTIIADMKVAMKAKNTQALKAIRMLLAALKQKEIDERIELTDTDVLAIVQKMIKQRKDSANQFQAANREDLVQIELAEIKVIEIYMPVQMSEEEISAIIQTTLSTMDNPSMADMGKLMGALKGQLAGKADMGLVNQLLRQQLA